MRHNMARCVVVAAVTKGFRLPSVRAADLERRSAVSGGSARSLSSYSPVFENERQIFLIGSIL